MNTAYYAFCVFMVLFFVIITGASVQSCAACWHRGGQPVRGVFGYVCLEPK